MPVFMKVWRLHTKQISTQDLSDSVQEEEKLHYDSSQCKVFRFMSSPISKKLGIGMRFIEKL